MRHSHAAVTFSAKGYDDVTCLLGANGVQVQSDGYGGWSTVSRPRNVGLLTWDGFAPLTMTVDVLFDGLQDGRSVEQDIVNLEKLAGRGPGVGSQTQPPDVTLTSHSGFASLVPHNFNGESVPWVVTVIDWGDMLRRRDDGHRVRQAATVTIQQHVQDKRLKAASVAQRKNAHGRRHRTHIVRKGETLMSIARAEYGNADRWQDIAKANGIKDPRHPAIGKHLKLPK